MIPNDISNKFFAGISRCIEEEAARSGYTVFFASSEENAERLGNVIDAVLAHNVDGVIVAPCSGGDAAIRRALDQRVPVVLLDRDVGGIDGVGKVLLDDEAAGQMATQLLIDSGYRHVEMISYTLGISSFSEREGGYRKTMMDNDLYDKAKVHYTTYATAAQDVENLIRDAASRGVEGLFLPSYSLSAQVLTAMKKLGLKTPGDLAIVGFDESDIFSLYETTVSHMVQPLKELGEKSVEVLIDMIQGKEPRKIVLKPELKEGGSTAKKA